MCKLGSRNSSHRMGVSIWSVVDAPGVRRRTFVELAIRPRMGRIPFSLIRGPVSDSCGAGGRSTRERAAADTLCAIKTGAGSGPGSRTDIKVRILDDNVGMEIGNEMTATGCGPRIIPFIDRFQGLTWPRTRLRTVATGCGI